MAKRKGRWTRSGALRPAGKGVAKRRGRGQLRTRRKIRRNHKDGLFCRLRPVLARPV